MKIINPKSLAETLDALNEMFFYERELTNAQRTEIAEWIAGRQGMPRSYAGMPAPTDPDFTRGIRIFTGERVVSGGSIAHILGQEACRALAKLDVHTAKVNKALNESTRGFFARLTHPGRRAGTYCCGPCTVAYWRHLTAGDLTNVDGELNAGVWDLREHRTDNGKWSKYPFFYTLLGLIEIDSSMATVEMRYAAPLCEKLLKHPATGKYDQRQHDLAERVLSRCDALYDYPRS